MMVFFVDINCNARQDGAIPDERMKRTNGIFLTKAILNEECANPVMDYVPSADFTDPAIWNANLIGVVH